MLSQGSEWKLQERRMDSGGHPGAQMATLVAPRLRKSQYSPMSKKLDQATLAVMNGNRPAPVRARIRRTNYQYGQAYPPDGQGREWWQRLKNALGTASSAFVEASLHQLIAAARLPCSGISEIAVNASLAFIEGAKPRDEVEGSLDPDGLHTYRGNGCPWDHWWRPWTQPKCRRKGRGGIPPTTRLHNPCRSPTPRSPKLPQKRNTFRFSTTR